MCGSDGCQSDWKGEGGMGDPWDGELGEISSDGYRDDALIVTGRWEGRRQRRASVSRDGGCTGDGSGPRLCPGDRIGGTWGNGRGVDGERGGERYTRHGLYRVEERGRHRQKWRSTCLREKGGLQGRIRESG